MVTGLAGPVHQCSCPPSPFDHRKNEGKPSKIKRFVYRVLLKCHGKSHEITMERSQGFFTSLSVVSVGNDFKKKPVCSDVQFGQLPNFDDMVISPMLNNYQLYDNYQHDVDWFWAIPIWCPNPGFVAVACAASRDRDLRSLSGSGDRWAPAGHGWSASSVFLYLRAEFSWILPKPISSVIMYIYIYMLNIAK